ncbi:hypothetical protein AJ78_02716 [Emergomyces pasteurianus Ep9510]|uniref:DUF155 domain-containing protein n=1 Tax=Emergomyces pasteurianus Ep9510 TaxID=1447872 RepID=A0A1J9QMR5_9EURO|nr:hypothetical protein AJ78_02716 [Emergomyces pasteurianus Ep9510]
MTSTEGETAPLLSHPRSSFPYTSQDEHRPHRTVTFDPITQNKSSTSNDTATSKNFLKPSRTGNLSMQPSSSSGGGGPPVLAALNSKLRRRHSQGASYNTVTAASYPSHPKIGPQRTSKNTQKLKLLPNPVTGEEDQFSDGEIPKEVYSQITRIKEPTARKHAARLGKADRDRVPRVTAYCTASSYTIDGVVRFLKSRAETRGSNPKLFDECVYSPYNYNYEDKRKPSNLYKQDEQGLPPTVEIPNQGYEGRRFSDSEIEVEGQKGQQRREELVDPHKHHGPSSESSTAISSTSHTLGSMSGADAASGPDLDTSIHTPEIFLFDYGTVVIWGMTPAQETRFLREVSKFASAVLSAEDTQIENFNFYYTRDYQARIYNDFISLQDPHNYMTKLAISHALSQSVKTSLFEDLVSETIAKTSPLPAQIAETGSVNLTRRQINMQIGELFILRINIHLQGSVLDSPELMWAEPQLDPVYQAVRSYLEMDQRVGLLTERLDVIADLLAVLKDQLSHRHGEYLEWIVIILIAAEIVVAGINIVVDLYAGVD